jgi:tRNA(fMet)-specific endonuclease VapC
MNGRYLLDTNVVIALFANDLAVIETISQADEVYIPCVAIENCIMGRFVRAELRIT